MALSYETLNAYIDGLYGDGILTTQEYNDIILYILANGEISTSARDLIQVRRGNLADLPVLAQGEIGFTLDEENMYVGGVNGNVDIGNKDIINQHSAQLADIAYQVPRNATATQMQTILNNAVNGSTITLATGVVYSFNQPITFGLEQKGIKIEGRGSTVSFTHNGDGFVLQSLNENFGSHILENIIIQGPNISYPITGYAPPSTGAGVRMDKSYYGVIRDCEIRGFNFGIWIGLGIKNNIEGKTYIRFNQFGVYFEGGAGNVNNFKGISIRENRKVGVFFKSGGTPFPSHNVFSGCLIETNIPFPYVSGGDSPTDSVGVYIAGGYDIIFDNCYFENHEHAIYVTGSSDGNKFTSCRFNRSADNTRLDGIFLKGEGIANTRFEGCYSSSSGSNINVEFDGTQALKNQFINCSGFTYSNFLSTSVDIFNAQTNQSGSGETFGAIAISRGGYGGNPIEGVAPNQINGIGTTTAILNAKGLGEVSLGSSITAPTTIENITNLRAGQIFVLFNYQIDHPITIKSSLDGINGLILKDKRDIVLSDYSHSVTFYVSGLRKIIEIGRNINKNWSNSGVSNIVSGTTSTVVAHGLTNVPLIINVTPRGNVGSVWITDRTLTEFTLNCSTAPVGATAFSWKAEL